MSSFLGNFYLRPVDAVLRKLDVRFIRYQDDIKVFAAEPHILRRAVAQMTPIVRQRGLNLATAKTKLLSGSEVISHFEDGRKDAIQYRIDVGDDDDEVTEDLHSLFDEAVTGAVNERDVRFAVYRMSKRHDDYAIPWIIDNLSEVPYLSELLVAYLSDQLSDHPDIEPQVIAFLSDERVNVSPFVEVQLLRMLARAPGLSESAYKAVWKILFNPASDSLSRQFAARAIGRHLRDGRSEDLAVLQSLFHLAGGDFGLRRALLVALKEGGDADKAFLSQVATGDPSLRFICRYLRSGPKLPPP